MTRRALLLLLLLCGCQRQPAPPPAAPDTTLSFPMTDTTYISASDTIFIGDGLRIAVTRDTISDAELMFMLVNP